LSLAAVLNMMTAVISHRGSYTATFANLTLPVFGWLGFRSLVALADGRVARNTIRAGLAIFLAIWLTALPLVSTYTSFSSTALWLLLTAAAGVMILSRSGEAIDAPLDDFGILIGVG